MVLAEILAATVAAFLAAVAVASDPMGAAGVVGHRLAPSPARSDVGLRSCL